MESTAIIDSKDEDLEVKIFWPSHRQRIHVPRSTSRLQNQQLPPRGGRSIWANTSSTKLQPVAGDPIIPGKRLLIQTDGRNVELKKWVYIDILKNSCKSKFHSQGVKEVQENKHPSRTGMEHKERSFSSFSMGKDGGQGWLQPSGLPLKKS